MQFAIDIRKNQRRMVPVVGNYANSYRLEYEMSNGTYSEAIKAAIEAKDILVEAAEVTVSAKASPDGKEHKRAYEALRPQTMAGMLALCDGKVEPSTPKAAEGKDERTDAQKAAGICDYFDYAYDLETRARIRAAMTQGLEGPDKAIEKVSKQLDSMIELGLMTREEADEQLAKIRERAKAAA